MSSKIRKELPPWHTAMPRDTGEEKLKPEVGDGQSKSSNISWTLVNGFNIQFSKSSFAFLK
jgi:hypothetical protein